MKLLRPHEWIRALRHRLDLSQKEFAKLLGVTQSVAAKFEKPAHSPVVRTLERVAAATGMTTELVLTPDRGLLVEWPEEGDEELPGVPPGEVRWSEIPGQ